MARDCKPKPPFFRDYCVPVSEPDLNSTEEASHVKRLLVGSDAEADTIASVFRDHLADFGGSTMATLFGPQDLLSVPAFNRAEEAGTQSPLTNKATSILTNPP